MTHGALHVQTTNWKINMAFCLFHATTSLFDSHEQTELLVAESSLVS